MPSVVRPGSGSVAPSVRKARASDRPHKPKPKPKPPGKVPSITLAVVRRVAARVGRGLTLELALAAEDCDQVNFENWHKTLQRHPELSTHYLAGKGQFLDRALERLAQSDELSHLRWLLERRHSDLFAKREPEVVVNNNLTLPADVLERARQLAKDDKQH